MLKRGSIVAASGVSFVHSALVFQSDLVFYKTAGDRKVINNLFQKVDRYHYPFFHQFALFSRHKFFANMKKKSDFSCHIKYFSSTDCLSQNSKVRSQRSLSPRKDLNLKNASLSFLDHGRICKQHHISETKTIKLFFSKKKSMSRTF